MNDMDLDVLDLEEQEEEIEKISGGANLIPFPAVSIRNGIIYFNCISASHFNPKFVSVSKSTNLVIFRECTDKKRGYTAIHTDKCKNGFCISAKNILDMTSLKPGTFYRLYAMKGGGVCIKRYEPIDPSEVKT